MKTPRSLVPAHWHQVLSPFLDILFPPLCHLCKAFIPDAGEIHLCADCLAQTAPISSPLCPVCGAPFMTDGGIDHLCSACSAFHPHFTAAQAAMVFDGTVRELIHRFKYDRKVQLRRPLGLIAAGHLGSFRADHSPDLIIPVPLHARRLKERGFNQALLLGEVIARRWGVPLSRSNLRRVRWTAPQITLSAAERADNVRNAFAVKHPSALKGKRIMLLDDVYTTGSTVRECAKTLKGAGAEAVFVACVARALP